MAIDRPDLGDNKDSKSISDQQQAGGAVPDTTIPIKSEQAPPPAHDPNQKAECGRPNKWEKATVVILGSTLVAAILAAVFTGWLAMSTQQLVADARLTSERQLRAYVLPRTMDEMWGIAGTPQIYIALRNSGPTPASDISIYGAIAVRQTNPKAVDFKENAIGTIDLIEPSAEATVSNLFTSTLRLTDKDRENIRDGIKAKIYLWGRISYYDIFGTQRDTFFCYSFYGIKQYPDVMPPVNRGPRAGNRAVCPHPKSS